MVLAPLLSVTVAPGRAAPVAATVTLPETWVMASARARASGSVIGVAFTDLTGGLLKFEPAVEGDCDAFALSLEWLYVVQDP